ncbi:MAG: prolyl oligopeptidase family serine peptidase [Planctomycetota bacterium]
MRPTVSSAASFLGRLTLTCCAILAAPTAVAADPPDGGRIRVFPGPALVIRGLSRPMRGTLFADPVQNLLAHAPADRPWEPREGDELPGRDGETPRWTAVGADASLAEGFRRGYIHATVDSETERVMIMTGADVGLCFVNGEPHAGDLYDRGLFPTPVLLRPGSNRFLLLVAGEKPTLELVPSTRKVSFAGRHVVPDLLPDSSGEAWAGSGVSNATPDTIAGLAVRATREDGTAIVTKVASIPPLCTLRVVYRIPAAPAAAGAARLRLELLDAEERPVETADLGLRLANPLDPREPHVQTFRSDIDGTVQYYAVKRAARRDGDPPPAVVLTLHGASVEAASHLVHIGGKSWAHLVSPTNRGPYGFDWEDIGRKDALEALRDAQARLPHDPTRVYLSGHSMGGHGTWNIGCLNPQDFAAIGPSAGWINYWNYRGHDPLATSVGIDAIMARPMLASDPERLLPNLRDRAVYVLHGSGDNNVPVDQSRRMATLLTEAGHRDWTYREEGGSHFWNGVESDSSTACVDWPQMMQCFARHVLPPDASVRSLELVSPNPRITSRLHWLSIVAQRRHGDLSRVKADCWPLKGEFAVESENVAALRLDLRHLRSPERAAVKIDGQQVAGAADAGGGLWLERDGDAWKVAAAPAPRLKGPHRYGPVKEEVDRRFLTVYGSTGTEAENARMLAKARYDAETYLSRAVSTPEVVSDVEFDAGAEPDRTILLVGNADANSAWSGLLPGSPVEVRRGSLRIGDRMLTGDDLAVLFVQPRPGSDTAAVVAIGATGTVGMQLAQRWSLFVPFVRYPDCVVVRAAAEPTGSPRTVAAGFFGRDWSVAGGEFAWAADEDVR